MEDRKIISLTHKEAQEVLKAVSAHGDYLYMRTTVASRNAIKQIIIEKLHNEKEAKQKRIEKC